MGAQALKTCRQTHCDGLGGPNGLLCTISDCFGAAMESAKAAAADGICQVVLYSDAATPGNVFRPDKGRKFEAFYWCALIAKQVD